MTPKPDSRLSVWAPAKINLGLEVLGPRPDGYHDLVTIFQALRFGDRVELELQEDPEITLRTEPIRLDLGPPAENLVVRAARELLARTGRRVPDSGGTPGERGGPGGLGLPGVRIRLTKRIPVGAGLGGGSSDAAATLEGLARLLGNHGWVTPELFPIARSLGADVPFFLEGGTRLGTGMGELLTPLPPWPRHPLVLVFPNVSVSTSSVFRRLESGLTPQGPLARMAGLGIPVDLWGLDWRELRNDLEPIVAAEHPAIREVIEEFERLGSSFARMSGTGSAVFGTAGSDALARDWVESFRARGFWAREVRPARSGCRLRESGVG